MSKKILLGSLFVGALTMGSCIQDEPLNAECDILSVSLHMDFPSKYLFHDYDTLQSVAVDYTYESDSIGFRIRSYEDVTSLPVSFKITEGAKIYHLSSDGTAIPFSNGSLVDFSDEREQYFRVVSQDGMWNRQYKVMVVHSVSSAGDLHFDFEEYGLETKGSYYEWAVSGVEGAQFFTDGKWKNGNPGFKLSMSKAKALDYPSVPLVGEGPDGSTCVKLETKNTGAFGISVNMRIASGSMFNGVFDVSNALKDALKATRFGSPFEHKPAKMTVWLKTEVGEKFQDRTGKPVEGVTDEPDAYVVFYRNQDPLGNKVMLDGNDVLSSPYIVGKGRLPHHYNEDGSDQLSNSPIHGLTSSWQKVEIPVEYTDEIDDEVLANQGYSLILGFASSWQGAYFKGAVGNRLYIDNLSLYCEY